jgi:hypothetical protein
MRHRLTTELSVALIEDTWTSHAAEETSLLRLLGLPEQLREHARRAASPLLSGRLEAGADAPAQWPQRARSTWVDAFSRAVGNEMSASGIAHWREVLRPYIIREAFGRRRIREADRVVNADDWAAFACEQYANYAELAKVDVVKWLNGLVAQHNHTPRFRRPPTGGEPAAGLIIRNASVTTAGQ